jgi:hypothetical protein
MGATCLTLPSCALTWARSVGLTNLACRSRDNGSSSVAHPAKMLPVIAATAITRYTWPGDLVADPMCEAEVVTGTQSPRTSVRQNAPIVSRPVPGFLRIPHGTSSALLYR